MATKEEARAHWNIVKSKFKHATPIRTAWTGTGWGTAASDFHHPMPNYIWVRDYTNRPFPVLNRGAVSQRLNVPVFLGYTDTEPEREQVIGVDYDAMIPDYGGGGGSIEYAIGPHHLQHEWFGGDEVFLDSKQIKPGLVKPTDPPSMQASVNSMTYFADGWRNFSATATCDLSGYKPTGANQKAVLIGIHLDTNQLAYVEGTTYATGTSNWAQLISGTAPTTFANMIPNHEPFYKPLAAVLLTASTTEISWSSLVDNILDLRAHDGYSGSLPQIVADQGWRLDEVELRTGFDPRLTTLGAATSRAAHYQTNAGMLRDTLVSDTAPTGSQFLMYNANSQSWEPQSISTAASEQHFSVTIGTSNTWNNELIPIWQAPRGMSVVLTEVLATTSGTSTRELGFDLEHRPWDSMQSKGDSIFGGSQWATSAGEILTTFAAPTLNPRSHLMFTTGSAAEAGSVNYLQLTIYYSRDLGFS